MSKQVRLTKRQKSYLWWICAGKTYEEVGIITGTSYDCVAKFMRRIMKKMGANTSKQTIYLATIQGLVEPQD